jgi:aspartyl-tRNA(Asn)/glutamyl-tRNA(Gln) amidotransferase subunit C
MKITAVEVEHVANLARLRLTHEEKELYREQLSAILEYAETLNAVDTSAVPPTAGVLPLTNVMRPDEPEAPLPVEDVLANAPRHEAGQFRVRPVFE